jgi:hypothetical protein
MQTSGLIAIDLKCVMRLCIPAHRLQSLSLSLSLSVSFIVSVCLCLCLSVSVSAYLGIDWNAELIADELASLACSREHIVYRTPHRLKQPQQLAQPSLREENRSRAVGAGGGTDNLLCVCVCVCVCVCIRIYTQTYIYIYASVFVLLYQ